MKNEGGRMKRERTTGESFGKEQIHPSSFIPHPSAKRRFGQNFLVDKNIVDRIISALGPKADETIIEIGPGRGALTTRLLQAAREL